MAAGEGEFGTRERLPTARKGRVEGRRKTTAAKVSRLGAATAREDETKRRFREGKERYLPLYNITLMSTTFLLHLVMHRNGATAGKNKVYLDICMFTY